MQQFNNNLPKILVITASAWRDDSNLGNTLTNFFAGYSKEKIAHLYCRTDIPSNSICNRYYRIPESDVIRSTVKRQLQIGGELSSSTLMEHVDGNAILSERTRYKFLRRNRLFMLLLLRELLWCTSKWKNNNLLQFLSDFKPDILYINFPKVHYVYNVYSYIHKYTNAKVIAFSDDDDYTLKQFFLSPGYWINRILLRKKIRAIVNKADLLYCISELQKAEYERIFKREFKILRKGSEFKEFKHKKLELNSPIRLVYTGNIYSGRWQTLARIGRVLKELNKDGIKAQLFIYTQNAVSGKMCKALGVADSVFLMGGIPFNKVREVLLDADIVVHVEAFGHKDRLETRLSFSTKLVDYFESGRCIFAVGWKDAASIDYLIQNDAAVVATSTGEMESKLKELISNHQLIMDYGQKAWNCGERNHQIDTIKKQFHKALQELAYAK